MSYRDDALARLDIRAFLEARGVALGKTVGPNEIRFNCPFHEDQNASANVNTVKGLWSCHGCNAGGSAIDFLMKQGMDYKEALTEIGDFAGLPPPSVGRRTNGAAGHATPAARPSADMAAKVKDWHEAALRNTNLMTWFHDHRGFTDATIVERLLGWDGQRVTIPIHDEKGKLLNVRRYLRDGKGDAGKMLWLRSGAESVLYPLTVPLAGEMVLVEGEWDAILMHQQGFVNTLTVTSGAGIWHPHFTPLFADRKVTIIYDNDEAGRKGAARVAAILSPVADVRILQIPNLPAKGDVTDFFVEQQRTATELTDLIADSTPYVLATSIVVDDTDPVAVPLYRASDARYRGQKLELSVLLSGKTMTPYTVPSEFLVTCDMSNKRFCPVCPMQAVSGRREVKVAASDPAVLSLINVTTASQYTAIKELAKAVPQCNRPQIEIKASTNIEELRLIPELDSKAAEGETEYVSRTGFFIGHGLLPNRSYRMIGYSHPSPKTQATVHLLAEAIPSQDNVSAFALTPEISDQLRPFQVAPGQAVEAKFRELYDDFRMTVHRIQDRFDMQIAYDLVWHSAIGFTFNGAYVRRGWVEAMVMGDSGQGKTEMAMALLAHYRMGERIQGEQSSTAGLIGGLEKISDTWMLSWGRIPLNDKRLLVIDETQGLKAESIESMSDVRATGVAEITKIRTEKTNARCRIVWLANPVTGLTLAQHNQGVLSIKELFKKPEDIRRLDFAIAVASADVDFARSINVRHDAATAPRFGSESCRLLVLWAWSRRADQIEFTSGAMDAILASATDMGRRYHPSIPLVEPSDQRLKLARLSVAAAARVYSTDQTGERVIVAAEHVAFVVAFLDRIYSARAMAYDEYSQSMMKGETLNSDEIDEVTIEIRGWTNSDDAISFLRTASIFRKTDLTDGLDWTDSYTRERLKFLTGHRLIRTTRNGYFKTPAFIVLLRSLSNGEDQIPDREGAPF